MREGKGKGGTVRSVVMNDVAADSLYRQCKKEEKESEKCLLDRKETDDARDGRVGNEEWKEEEVWENCDEGNFEELLPPPHPLLCGRETGA